MSFRDHLCYCGFQWTDYHILNGHKEDENGEYFQCPKEYNEV